MVKHDRRSFIKLGLGLLSASAVGALGGCGSGSGGGSGGGTAAVVQDTGMALPPLTSDAASPVVQTLDLGTGVSVPQNFLGMHFHYYPQSTSGTVSPAPTFGYGTWRSHDHYGAASGNSGAFKWFNLSPSPASTISDIYDLRFQPIDATH